jgi:hypothetical protein
MYMYFAQSKHSLIIICYFVQSIHSLIIICYFAPINSFIRLLDRTAGIWNSNSCFPLSHKAGKELKHGRRRSNGAYHYYIQSVLMASIDHWRNTRQIAGGLIVGSRCHKVVLPEQRVGKKTPNLLARKRHSQIGESTGNQQFTQASLLACASELL